MSQRIAIDDIRKSIADLSRNPAVLNNYMINTLTKEVQSLDEKIQTVENRINPPTMQMRP